MFIQFTDLQVSLPSFIGQRIETPLINRLQYFCKKLAQHKWPDWATYTLSNGLLFQIQLGAELAIEIKLLFSKSLGIFG